MTPCIGLSLLILVLVFVLVVILLIFVLVSVLVVILLIVILVIVLISVLIVILLIEHCFLPPFIFGLCPILFLATDAILYTISCKKCVFQLS